MPVLCLFSYSTNHSDRTAKQVSSKAYGGEPSPSQTYPVIFCDLRFWYSTSSTVHTAPLTFSTRTKHLCRLRLCRTAF